MKTSFLLISTGMTPLSTVLLSILLLTLTSNVVSPLAFQAAFIA